MPVDGATSVKQQIAEFVTVAKDLVSLLRDASIFLLALLLVAFPASLNTMLSDAGFEEGSFAGLKWKKQLAGTNQDLQSAQQTISSLQQRNDELLRLVNDANAGQVNQQLQQKVAKLDADNQSLRQQAQKLQSRITETIERNIPLVEKAANVASSMSVSSERKYYVIALTSSTRDDVMKELGRVKAKVGAGFEAEFPDPVAYAPEGGLYTLLVSSRPLPFEEASQLKKSAIAAGFSSSTWLWQSDVAYFEEKK